MSKDSKTTYGEILISLGLLGLLIEVAHTIVVLIRGLLK